MIESFSWWTTFYNQELWLKDVALSRFADTKDCLPSLVRVNYF